MALPGRALAITATVVVLVVAVSALMAKTRSDTRKADSAAASTAGANGPTPEIAGEDLFGGKGPLPVHGALVVKDTLVISVNASGQAAAWQQIPLMTEVAGRISSVPVRENDGVAARGVVLAFDTTEFAFALAEANAAMQRATAQYKAEIITDYRIEDAALRASRDSAARMKSGIVEAEIRLQRAKLDYERVKVRAPFTGRVADIKVVPGQRIAAGTEIMKLIDLDPIKVEVQVLESQVGLLGRGRKAQVTFAAYPEEVFDGEIETINPMVDQSTRMARVTVTIPNGRGRILPGMYARVKLAAIRLPNRILVPRTAVLQRGRNLVMVYRPEGDAGVTEWRYVTLGEGNDEVVEILENPDTKMVEPGEIVLTNGHYTIQHDAPVRLVNKPSGDTPN
jgi:HlyD family secretion protein